MKKRTFYTELAYVFGILLLAVGTAFMEITDLGVSMVVAPAYILHLKISQFLPFFSFGMAEYTLQAFILICLMIFMKRARLSYFFSFVTAVIYGFALDGAIAVISLIPVGSMIAKIGCFGGGMLLCSCGVSLLFNTYISPEAYELFVKEISAKYNLNIHRFKTVYDCASCLIAVILSFCFFGLWHFEGVKVGTVVCALLNGTLIHLFSILFEKIFSFKDALPLKKYF